MMELQTYSTERDNRRERNVFPWEKLKESRNHEVCVKETLCFLSPQAHAKIGHRIWARSLRLVGRLSVNAELQRQRSSRLTVHSKIWERSTDCTLSRAFIESFRSWKLHYSPAVKLSPLKFNILHVNQSTTEEMGKT